MKHWSKWSAADCKQAHDELLAIHRAVAAERERCAREMDEAAKRIDNAIAVSVAAERERCSAEIRELRTALEGMLLEWDNLARYGSPIAKAANERVNAARAAIRKGE